MKTSYKILIFASLIFFMSGCKNKKNVADAPLKDFPSIENTVQLQLPSEVNYKGQTSNFEVLEMHPDGRFLLVKVAYSGGCNEHYFEASWDEQYLKSLPPQVNIHLTHVNNDDACRMRIEREIAIDLKKLFLNTPNNVVLILNNNTESKILVSPQE